MFSRRRRNEKAANGPATAQQGGYNNTPFRFGSWIRLHGVDILTMAIMGALGLGIYFAPPAPNRSFPVYNVNGEVVYPEFAYPLRKQIVPIWASALISFFAPFFFFTLFQVRRRSADDWLSTNLGLLKSLITAAVFQVFIKWLIGGLRPHFYAVCQPNVQPGQQTGIGFANLMYDRSICTGNQKEINDSLESMPSGHSTAAWAGLLYLSLYLNAQLKVMSAHNPAYWKMILFFAPLLGACLISGSLTIDQFHNWYDVLAGAIIGSACALVAFRQTFAAIWDFRFNHILLPRATSLFHRSAFLPGGRGPYYTYQPTTHFLSHDLPFTREGGWGHGGGEQSVGAPGDASVLTTGLANIGSYGAQSSSGMNKGGMLGQGGGMNNGGMFGQGGMNSGGMLGQGGTNNGGTLGQGMQNPVNTANHGGVMNPTHGTHLTNNPVDGNLNQGGHNMV